MTPAADTLGAGAVALLLIAAMWAWERWGR
jgi:hypothetical protein